MRSQATLQKSLIFPQKIILVVESELKSFLISLASKRAPGPSPSFNIFDIIRFVRLLAVSGNIGRGRIAKELNLGEGAVRTLLRRLTEAGLVITSRSGCSLTHKGMKLWSEIERVLQGMVRIGGSELTLAPYSVAILVRGCADKVKSGIEQRDAAIVSGARGAVTIIFKNNRMIIPGVSENMERDYPSAFRELSCLMKPREGDVIIVSSADSQRDAEYGALAAAWSLL
ncbi:MAG: DUF4443 domain-containing protein [Candidatus Bathyarchaeia archaeon]